VYDVMLIVKNQAGCVDTVIKRNYITVAGPRSSFSTSQDTVCGAGTVLFTNTSTFAEQGTGIFYPLGLDSVQTTMSFQTTASYTYTFPEGMSEDTDYVEYYPFLRYFDRDGCRDNFGYTDTIRIYRPITARIYAQATLACAPNGFMLVDTSSRVRNRYWDLDANGVPDDSSRTVQVMLNAPDSRRTVLLYVDNGFGCFDTTTIELRTFNNPAALFTVQDSVGCPGIPTAFINQLDTIAAPDLAFLWEFGDQATSTAYSPEHVYAVAGVYTVRLTVFDNQGCSSEHEKVLNLMIPQPVPDFEPKTAELEFFPFDTEIQFTNRSLEATNWVWDFGDGVTSTEPNPKHTYTREDTFFVSLRATNRVGCAADTTFGPFIVIDKHVYFPNVFTPNGDGQNDRLEVRYKGQKEVSILLFDRFGNQLPVEIRPGQPGWDGQLNGRNAPDGVYFAVIKVGNQEYTKPVTLIR
jgi:gliding motility-associated-like protein